VVPQAPTSHRRLWQLWAAVPLVLLALLAVAVLRGGDALISGLGANPPAADAFEITRVLFDEEGDRELRIRLTSPQRDELTIAAVAVDDAFVPFEVDGSRTIDRLDRRTIVVPYDWIPDEPYLIGVTSSSGIETTFEVPAAVRHESASGRGIRSALLVGLLVGFVPVALGLMWLPALRGLSDAALGGFMALTAGLLTFLAVDALEEALDLAGRIPAGVAGPGLVVLGVAGSYLGLTWVSHYFSARRKASAGHLSPVQLALLIAVGIGVHNFGEGLAIGTSFAIGELTLGLLLIVGFMVHNVTEGLGISVPLARSRPGVLRLLGLAVVAGVPASAGVLIGRYVTNDALAVVFFALAAGAALQVIAEVVRYLRRTSPDGSLFTGRTALGFVTGLLVMYLTGLLIG